MAWKVFTRPATSGLDSAGLRPPRTPSPRFPQMHKLQDDHICKVLTPNQLLWSKVPQSSHQGQRGQRNLWSFQSWLCAGVRLLAHAGPQLSTGGAVPTSSGGEAGVGMGSAVACAQEAKASHAGSTRSHQEACQGSYHSTIRVISLDLRRQASNCALQDARSP